MPTARSQFLVKCSMAISCRDRGVETTATPTSQRLHHNFSPAASILLTHQPRDLSIGSHVSQSSISSSISRKDSSIISKSSAISTASVDKSLFALLKSKAPSNFSHKGYHLPCEFAFIGCHLQFHPDEDEYWIHHSIAHFQGLPPPSFASCTFCDVKFRSEDGPLQNWRRRMMHVRNHFADELPNETRSDYWVVQYMKQNDLIDDEDYLYGLKTSYQPQPNLIIQSSFEASLIARTRESDLWEEDELRKQNRQRSKSRSKAAFSTSIREENFWVEHDLAKEDRQRNMGLIGRRKHQIIREKPIVIQEGLGASDSYFDLHHVDVQALKTKNEDLISFPEETGAELLFDSKQTTPFSTLAEAISTSTAVSSITTSMSESSANEEGFEQELDILLDAREIKIQTLSLWSRIAENGCNPGNKMIFQMLKENATAISRWGWGGIFHNHGSSQTSNPTASSTSKDLQLKSSTPAPSKRRLEKNGDDHSEEDEDGFRGQPVQSRTPRNDNDFTLWFACPYRKRNPQKYNVRDWRSCAITARETVARVKGHLYQKHLITQCDRCKILFATEKELDRHENSDERCPMIDGVVDGITRKMAGRLRSRKKQFRGQTEAQAWEHVYKVLFPDEELPNSPYFDPIKDESTKTTTSQDFRDLMALEQFIGPEIERLFLLTIETESRENTSTDLSSLTEQMVQWLRSAQHTAFENYRATLNNTAQREIYDMAQTAASQSARNIFDHSQSSSLPPSTPSNPQSEAAPNRGNGSSDSGYASNLMDAGPSYLIDLRSSARLAGEEGFINTGQLPRPNEMFDSTSNNLYDITNQDHFSHNRDQAVSEFEFPAQSFPDLIGLDDWFDWTQFSQSQGNQKNPLYAQEITAQSESSSGMGARPNNQFHNAQLEECSPSTNSYHRHSSVHLPASIRPTCDIEMNDNTLPNVKSSNEKHAQIA